MFFTVRIFAEAVKLNIVTLLISSKPYVVHQIFYFRSRRRRLPLFFLRHIRPREESADNFVYWNSIAENLERTLKNDWEKHPNREYVS